MTTPAYWDSVSERERFAKTGLAEEYTRHQMLEAFNRGLRWLSHKQQLAVLKLDLWTESAARQREVLSRMYPIAAKWEQSLTVHCVDISARNCRVARSYYPDIPICQATIEHLPFKDELFDLIFDPSTSDHLPLERAQGAFNEYVRCLKQGGVIVLMFAHSGGTLERLRTTSSDYYTFPIGILGQCERLEEHPINSLNTLPLSRLPAVLPAAFWTFQHLEYGPWFPRWLAPLYVIIARKR